MRIAVIEEPGKIEIQSKPVPLRSSPEMVLVKILICGICGSDVAVWNGNIKSKYPYSPGHEFCGLVQEADKAITKLMPGDLVVINPNLNCEECYYCKSNMPNLCVNLKNRPIKSNGGFSEYVALDYRMLHLLPQDLSEEIAVFIEPFSCALHIVDQARINTNDYAVIFGGGTMGLLVSRILMDMGIRFDIVEPEKYRMKEIERITNLNAIHPEYINKRSYNEKYNIAFECSGNASAVSLAIDMMLKGGRIVVAGIINSGLNNNFVFNRIVMKELEIKGAWLNPGTFNSAIELTIVHKFYLQQLKTMNFQLKDIKSAFDRASETKEHRILIKPG